jgi:hypothetical protein
LSNKQGGFSQFGKDRLSDTDLSVSISYHF